MPIPPSPETSAGDPGEVRRAGHRVRARSHGRVARSGVTRGRARRRHAAALRPVPRHPGAPGAGGGRGGRHDARTAGSRWIRTPWRPAFPDVYAVGDVTSVGTPKAGVFAEGAARVVADQLIARVRGEAEPPGYDGTGACWIEFGDEQVGARRRGLLLDPGLPDRHVRAAIGRDGGREGLVRRHSPRTMVRHDLSD